MMLFNDNLSEVRMQQNDKKKRQVGIEDPKHSLSQRVQELAEYGKRKIQTRKDLTKDEVELQKNSCEFTFKPHIIKDRVSPEL